MSGAEALLAIGIIANIVQIVDFTSRAVERVKDSAQNVSKAFQDVQNALPLLASTLGKTEDQIKAGSVDEGTCKALRPVLKACEAKIKELEAIFTQAVPAEGASTWKRGWKAFASLGKDKKVGELARQLSELRSSLIYYHVTTLATDDRQSSVIANTTGSNKISTVILDQKEAHQRESEERCLHSLAFPSMDNRRLTIEEPAEDTCDWIFEHPLYQQWSLRTELAASQGLLWIKGKPGSGKSTMMKRLVERAEEELHEGSLCISFFFSARRGGLDRNVEGLYRSLTHQLVRKRRELLGELVMLAVQKDIRHGVGNWTWHAQELKKFFHASIVRSEYGPLKVFVDALDECKEDDVQEVVIAFERSAAVSIANGYVLDVCWSSRHYPHIRVKKSLTICMEVQNTQDISTYVRKKVGESSSIDRGLEKEIMRKANGVFLWVVLVFRQLLDANDQGFSRAEKYQILQDLPSELDDLFQMILRSVKFRHQRIRALLFKYAIVASDSEEVCPPLMVKQMQYALAFSVNPIPEFIRSWLASGYIDPHVAFPNYVREVSGGLLEVSQYQFYQDEYVVQFIHESAREFVLDRASHEIFGLACRDDVVREGYQSLRDACLNYLSCRGVLDKVMDDIETLPDTYHDRADRFHDLQQAEYGFLSYAMYWPWHARAAEQRGQSQVDLIAHAGKPFFRTALQLWLSSRSLYPHSSIDALGTREMLFWASCIAGLQSCIHPLVEAGVDPLFDYKGVKGPWRSALERKSNVEILKALIDVCPTNSGGYPFTSDAKVHRGLWSSSPEIVEALVAKGFSARSRDDYGREPIAVIIISRFRPARDKVALIKTLAARDTSVTNAHGYSLLHLAITSDPRPELICGLIETGVNLNAVDSDGRTGLHLAVELLLGGESLDAWFNLCGRLMSQYHFVPLHTLPVEIRSIADRTTFSYMHPFTYIKSRAALVQALIDVGSNLNAQDKDGNTSLHLAVRGHFWARRKKWASYKLLSMVQKALMTTVQALVDAGTDITVRNNDGLTPTDLISGLPNPLSEEIKAILTKEVS